MEVLNRVGLDHLIHKIKGSYDKLGSDIGKGLSERVKRTINVTHAELVNLKANSKLEPGQQYRITDYVTKVNPFPSGDSGRTTYYISAEHPFDIVVTAVSDNELDTVASAAIHEGDTYFEGQHLKNWKIWYELEYSKGEISCGWAVPENEFYVVPCTCYDDGDEHSANMGIVFPHEDNVSVYDTEGNLIYSGEAYKSIDSSTTSSILSQATCGVVYNNTLIVAIHLPDGGSLSGVTGGDAIFPPGSLVDLGLGSSIDIATLTKYSSEEYLGKGYIYRMIDDKGNDCPYDFKNIQFIDWDYTNSPNNEYVYTFTYSGDTGILDASLVSACNNNVVQFNVNEARPGNYPTSSGGFTLAAFIRPLRMLNHNAIILFQENIIESNVFKVNSCLNHIKTSGSCAYNEFGYDAKFNYANYDEIFNGTVVYDDIERCKIKATYCIVTESGKEITTNGYGQPSRIGHTHLSSEITDSIQDSSGITETASSLVNGKAVYDYAQPKGNYQTAGDYKTKQTAVSSPSANGNAMAFIDTVSQNADGVISATKKSVPTGSTSAYGLLKIDQATADGFISTLKEGDSAPTDESWYITSVSSGTGATFYKRQHSYLADYLKTKFLPLTGGTMTGTITSRNITPSANATYSLGTSSVKYKEAYVSDVYASNTVNVGSGVIKYNATTGCMEIVC